MKVGEVQNEFKRNFSVTIRIFNKLQNVPSDIKLDAISESNHELIIEGENTIGEVIEMFHDIYNIKIQIADEKDTHLLNKEQKFIK
jgi:hypothetical protein